MTVSGSTTVVGAPRHNSGTGAAFRAGGHLLIFCNPYNPLGRVITPNEMTQLTDMVDRHGGRVFADEVHAPLVYPGNRHIPYASTSDTAATLQVHLRRSPGLP